MIRDNTFGSPIDYERAGRRLGRGPNAEYRPAELRQRAIDYFEYMRGVVWNRIEVLKGGFTAGMLYEVPTSCPLDLKGFLAFAGFGMRRWERYKADEAYQDVCEWVEMIIEDLPKINITTIATFVDATALIAVNNDPTVASEHL